MRSEVTDRVSKLILFPSYVSKWTISELTGMLHAPDEQQNVLNFKTKKCPNQNCRREIPWNMIARLKMYIIRNFLSKNGNKLPV